MDPHQNAASVGGDYSDFSVDKLSGEKMCRKFSTCFRPRPWPVSVCTMICDSVLRGCCPNRREFIVDAETWFVTVIGFIRPGELFYAMNTHPNSHQWPRSWKPIMYLSEKAHQLMEWNCWQMLLQGIWSGGGFAGSRRIILLFSLKRRIDWWL